MLDRWTFHQHGYNYKNILKSAVSLFWCQYYKTFQLIAMQRVVSGSVDNEIKVVEGGSGCLGVI